MKILTMTAMAILALALTTPATASPMETKLVGTLTIDFDVPDDNPTIPADFIFTVAKDTQYSLYDPSGTAPFGSDFPVPKAVRGGTFKLNDLCTNTIAGDTTAGGTQLRVSQKNVRGTLYWALVTSGAATCLFVGGATRVDSPFDDPFFGNTDVVSALAGERGIWLAQILNAAEDGGVEGANTLRTFFEIPVASTIVEPVYGTIEVSTYLNRGGSALHVVNKDIILKFKQP